MGKEVSPPFRGSPAAAVCVVLVRRDETQVIIYHSAELEADRSRSGNEVVGLLVAELNLKAHPMVIKSAALHSFIVNAKTYVRLWRAEVYGIGKRSFFAAVAMIT